MKLIGINAHTRVLRLPRGAPYHLKLRVKDQAGEPQALIGRDLALTLYRGSTVFGTVAGVIGDDDLGPFASFALPGSVSAAVTTSCDWELAEIYADGKAPLLAGQVNAVSSASSAAGDGLYNPSSAADELSWSPSTETLLIVERGPKGPPADGVADPGDLTLIFDNHLI